MAPSLPVAALVRTDFCIPHTDALKGRRLATRRRRPANAGLGLDTPLPAVDETEPWSCLLSNTDKLEA